MLKYFIIYKGSINEYQIENELIKRKNKKI
jgi:hypothetical protein